MRTFQGQIAGWLWLHSRAAGGRRRRGDRSLPQTSTPPKNRSSQRAALRCAGRLRFARCRDADKSRTRRIPQCAGHQFARSSGSNRHADGSAQIAGLDFATAARSHPTRMPATDDCRSLAGTGPARVDSDRIEIDPRHRTRSGTFRPGVWQCARFGRAKNVVATDPDAESRITETD